MISMQMPVSVTTVSRREFQHPRSSPSGLFRCPARFRPTDLSLPPAAFVMIDRYTGRPPGRPAHRVDPRDRTPRAEPESGDEQVGNWTPERLVEMDARFAERLERAVA